MPAPCKSEYMHFYCIDYICAHWLIQWPETFWRNKQQQAMQKAYILCVPKQYPQISHSLPAPSENSVHSIFAGTSARLPHHAMLKWAARACVRVSAREINVHFLLTVTPSFFPVSPRNFSGAGVLLTDPTWVGSTLPSAPDVTDYLFRDTKQNAIILTGDQNWLTGITHHSWEVFFLWKVSMQGLILPVQFINQSMLMDNAKREIL